MLKIKQNNSGDQSITKRSEEDSGTLLPIELTHVPGIIDMQTAYTESISRYPNRRTAFVGALAMLSFAAGRWYRTDDNMRTNEYFVCYANSGAGKDAPRKVNRAIAIECGCAANIGDSIGSGEGLQDTILAKSKFLLQNDEFDTLIRAIAEDKTGTKESLVREILAEYSSSGSMISRRSLSTAISRSAGKDFCIHPHLSIYGSTVGQYLFETLNDRVLENGLVARCLFVDCGRRQKRQIVTWEGVPDELVKLYRGVLRSVDENGKISIPDAPDVKNLLTPVSFSRDAFDCFEEIADRHDDEYDSLNNGQNAAEQSFKARTCEHVTKLAMLWAISENWETPVITVDALKWADAFVCFCQDSMLKNIERFTAANPHEANAKRIMRKLEKCDEINMRDICKCLRLPISDAESTIDYLVAIEAIREIGKDTGIYRKA